MINLLMGAAFGYVLMLIVYNLSYKFGKGMSLKVAFVLFVLFTVAAAALVKLYWV